MEIVKSTSSNEQYEEMRKALNELYSSKDVTDDEDIYNTKILELSQYMDTLYNKIC